MNLINKKLLQQKYASFEFPTGKKSEEINSLIDKWQRALKDSDLENTKEKSIQGKFLQTFFENILGYDDVTSAEKEYTLIQHPRIENNVGEPDGSLGFFTKDNKDTRVVIELKDAKTDLDRKQNRDTKQTPVDQAFNYASKEDKCRWIIVSNFKEIRLYSKSRSQEYYEKFMVRDLLEDQEFKRFYFLLSRGNLIRKDGDSIVDVLATDSTQQEQDITNEFYSKYKEVRLGLLNHLIDNNKDISAEILLEKTQKLLDRIVFALFCEDTTELLPYEIVKNTYQRALNSFANSDERVWNEFKGLFKSIDEGNSRVTPPINAYNGGLFKKDDILDNLVILDRFWGRVIDLADYDYQTDINVNILGHIFEQSISDLEEIKESVLLTTESGDILTTEDGIPLSIGKTTVLKEKKGRRKKDGIFYTPEFITKYIVENTVGKYLEENPDRLTNIKILDPACGSGAFLNQAHSYLKQEYARRFEIKLQEMRDAGKLNLEISDYDPASVNNAILLNNLFGVDLNNESVEITKLALWLKTAKNTEPLQNLDKNIRCGNSLINDSLVAGDKAFKWDTEFKEVIGEGGFDIIIGNPPYVNVEGIGIDDRNYLLNKYKFLTGRFDLYVAFIEKGLSLLQDNGYLAFILPYPFLYERYAEKIRRHIAENFTIDTLVDLREEKIFKDAVVRSTIIIIKKSSEKKNGIITKYRNGIFIEQGEINQEVYLRNPNSSYKFEINTTTIPILEKIEKNSILLGDIYYINWGLRTGNISKYVYKNPRGITSERKMINGRNIYPFGIEYSNDYVNYLPDELYNPMFPELFENQKIFVPDISGEKGIRASVDINNYYAEHTVSVLVRKNLLIDAKRNEKPIVKDLKTQEIDDYYTVALLNSNLLNFYFKSKLGGGLHVYPSDLAQLPIRIANNMGKISEISKKISELSASFLNNNRKCISFLEENYNLRFKDYIFNIGWNEIKEKLPKSTTLANEKELFDYVAEQKHSLKDLYSQINGLKEELNNMFYQAYKLTPEDIAIIESNIV